MNILDNAEMPKAGGHYSMCIEHNGLLYISGQLPFKADRREFPEGIEAQTTQVFSNIDRILKAANSSKNKVLQVRIYLSDIADWEVFNRIYADYFADHKPVRCVVGAGLHYGALLEVELTAIK